MAKDFTIKDYTEGNLDSSMVSKDSRLVREQFIDSISYENRFETTPSLSVGTYNTKGILKVEADTTDPTGEAVYGRIPILVNGVVKYLATYNAP